MKKFTKFFINRLLVFPFPSKIIQKINLFVNLYQGKGWGSETFKDEINNCLSLLKIKPKIFVDIGANKGKYTKLIIDKFHDIECYIFEPSSFNDKILKNMFANNKNVTINNFALSSKASKTKLYSNEEGSGWASLTKRRLDHFGTKFDIEEEIESKRFDEYWSKNNKILDYVKIDVEGHEMEVLNGFGDLIFNTRLIQFEFGGCNIDTKTYFQDFWYYFLDKNFLIYRITPRGPKLLNFYNEIDEFFLTTNYVAINKTLI